MKRSKSSLVAGSLLCMALASGATTRYVDINNPAPAAPYTAWATAATNIQDAIDVAEAGDEIVVANGVYQTGARELYGMSNRVAVTKAVIVRSVNGPEVTCIVGSGPRTSDAVRCVYLTNNALLAGFTLTNGSAQLYGEYTKTTHGGGAWCESVSAVLSNCVVANNSARWGGGGGVYQGTLNNCNLTGNSAFYGGGADSCMLNNCTLAGNSDNGAYSCTLNNCTLMGNGDSGAGWSTLNNCTLVGNSAYRGGGAWHSTLNNCTLLANSVSGSDGDSRGGGAFDSTLNNCTLMGNSSAGSGGGASQCILNNCTLAGNSAQNGGGACIGMLNNCIIYYNTATNGANYLSVTLTNCCTTPLPAEGADNIANEPLFVDTNGWSNLRIQAGSPCINAGNNAYAPGPTDLDSNPRITGGIVDIGAYEFQLDSDADGIPDKIELQWGLNPTNGLDAATCPLGDRLTYLQKYLCSLNIATNDTDGDGLTDYDEIFIYHSKPLLLDSNGNGVSDGAEVASGHDPTFTGTRYYYDKNDRLVGAEHAKGLSLGYQYDGNGNILRQAYLGYDQSTNGLPALWKFLNRLSTTNSTGTNSPYADPDGDGWSNYQEWNGNSDPLAGNSVPLTNVVNTAPITLVLTNPASGNGLATNLVTIWDAEGNAALIEMEFQTAISTNWTNLAAIVAVDGGGSGSVSTHPTGITHQVIWNAAQVFGAGFTNNLNLRARARDVTLTGAWSPPIGYRVEISVGNPMATNDAVVMLEDTQIDLNVLSNDSVQPPATKQIAAVGQPTHGTTMTNADSTIRYVPMTNWFGTDSFVYTLTDGAGGMSMAQVSVTVIPVNDPPVAGSYTNSTTEDLAMSLRWNPARDAEGDTVVLQSAGPTSAQGGSVSVVGDVLTYTPGPNFNGVDTFSYTLVDNGTTAGTNDFKTATGTVWVNVSAVNDAPVISVPESQTLAEDSLLVFTNITVTDVDADSGQILTTLSATNGVLQLSTTNGIAFITGSNASATMSFNSTLAALQTALTNLTYRPLTNVYGTDLLTITVNDQGNTGAGGPLSDTKSIVFQVNPVNDVPVVTLTSPTNGTTYIAPGTILLQASASDVDGQVVKVEFFSGTNRIGSALTNPPYQYIWSNVPAGTYNLFARATDNLDATNNSLIALVTSKEPGFVKLDSPQNSGGSFSLMILGEAAQTYDVQASTNLNDWSTIATVTNTTGTVQYTDSAPPSSAQRYYRAKIK